MSEELEAKIIERLKSEDYRPQSPRGLADELNLKEEAQFHSFRNALRELTHQGRVVVGARGAVVLPSQHTGKDEFVGTYRHNRRGFGFVVPTDPESHEDLFVPEGKNAGAITGDIVRAKIAHRGQRDGKAMHSGHITEILQRTQKRFVGTLQKVQGKLGAEWFVLPDGNTLTEAIVTPDAAARHVKPGTKVVVEITTYAEDNQRPQGVITEILGEAGEKDVDLRSVIVQFNLPGEFPPEVLAQAREAVDAFDPAAETAHRYDLSEEVICTIDPDDAKDYDDAISLRELEDGNWELGVHIADVSHFVKEGTPLDLEGKARGNSCYFPGHVIPMLPEILSNGVCSLQEAVPRLCKSVFIVYDDHVKPIRTRFANTIIKSRKRLRYKEAQAILDHAQEIPHPEGPRPLSAYPEEVVDLLHRMSKLAKRLHKRRQAQGQVVLDLPEVDLVLDENGKVVDAVPEDQSFTHTLIEMFMVEANEAVARLYDSQGVPFLRRTHPGPEVQDNERLRHFAGVIGYKLGKEMDRKALQHLLATVRGKPEGYAINLAVLKSLSRAEYSPEPIGHYALASEHYAHFTSPIRRYADLTIHRLLDSYLDARDELGMTPSTGAPLKRRRKLDMKNVIPYDQLVQLGRQISFTERRADDAERELRKVKILELLKNHIGDEFMGVVTGITNFGIFVQIQAYLIDGLIRYEDLMDDWWDVDERSGLVRGQRTGKKIGIGDVVKVVVVNVDQARRELNLAVREILGRPGGAPPVPASKKKVTRKPVGKNKDKMLKARGGETRRNRVSKTRGKRGK